MTRTLRLAGLAFVSLIAVVWIVYPALRDLLNPHADGNQSHCVNAGTGVEDPALISRPSGGVKIIALNDYGEFVNRCQLTDVLFDLNWDLSKEVNDLRPPVRSDARKLPKLVVLYVHGWKHNAETDDDDLKSFEQLIDGLKARQTDKKNVLGIYIGWNAKLGWGPVDNLTFWEKSSVADRIAQSGVVTKIVSAIGSVLKRDTEKADQFIAIGHSFGARIIYSATAQNLIYETEQAHPGHNLGIYKQISSSANAVILLNPAFEAARYEAIADISREYERFNISQNPLLVSISSENDWATNVAFPVGAWLGLERDVKERTTIGNFNAFITHRLKPIENNSCVREAESSISDLYASGELCLKRNDEQDAYKNHNPFIIAKADKAIIAGHGDIWNPKFSKWLFEFIDALAYSVAVSNNKWSVERKDYQARR